MKLDLENSYLSLGEKFYELSEPTPVSAPKLLFWNEELARELGIELKTEEATEIFSGNKIPTHLKPMALAYAGHQFGHFVPQLGDGRAHYLGEARSSDGFRYDIQLKGSGPTKFSRQGDGRSPLGPVVRECILSESMHALGVPSTRTLAALSTGEIVRRESDLAGGISVRVARSHLRIGSFEYFSFRKDNESLSKLLRYALDKHSTEPSSESSPLALQLLHSVAKRQAYLVAQWLSLGFIHGVMNTDNTTISGETIDYGPCAFLDQFDPNKVFSSIDRRGRYSYGQQPSIMQWNLSVLGDCLLPLLSESMEEAVALVQGELEFFATEFRTQWTQKMSRKLGLRDYRAEDDESLVTDFLEELTERQLDYTNSFRALSSGRDAAISEHWKSRWQNRLKEQKISLEKIFSQMKLENPAFIPRNHLVERAIRKAVDEEDPTEMIRLIELAKSAYKDPIDPDSMNYQPASPEEEVLQTFCGT